MACVVHALWLFLSEWSETTGYSSCFLLRERWEKGRGETSEEDGCESDLT
jgi:hypothetical protein